MFKKCEGTRYPSAYLAFQTIINTLQNSKANAFKCRRCKGWHIRHK